MHSFGKEEKLTLSKESVYALGRKAVKLLCTLERGWQEGPSSTGNREDEAMVTAENGPADIRGPTGEAWWAGSG